MPNIDTLSIQFSTKGTKTAINNITAMGVAVKGLASNINSIDAGKIDALANSLKQLRGSAPTKDQTARIVGFGNAISGVAKLFDGVDNSKIQGFANALGTIKSAVPTKNQNENIGGFGMALGGMGNALNSVDGSKLNVFVNGMTMIRKAIPTSKQVGRISEFAVAVKELSDAIGAANITEFSNDMSVLGSAVEQFKKSSVNSITNAVTAMKNMGQTAVQTANQVANATPKTASEKPVDNNDNIKQAQTLIASLDQVKFKARGIVGIMQKLGLATPTKQFRNLEAQAEKVRAKYEELRASMQKALNSGDIKVDSPEYKKKMAQLDALRNSYNELILKQRELAQEGGAVQFSPYLTQSLDAFKTGATKAVSLLKRGLVSGFKIATTHIKSFASKVKQAGSALKNTVFSGNSATSMAKKFANEIFRVSKMLKLMVTRMALRKVIAEVGNGFKSLAIHSDEFNDSVSGIMNASKQLGYSFSAMVSPLINALAPALIYIINIFTKLVNIINQVFSALTGKTSWNKAKEFTESWRDSFDDTTESAKKTTKELKKTVLGFDELNQLQDNTDKSASTTKSNPVEDMFETVKIDKKWKDLAKWLKDMWKIGDFTELGTKLGKKLKKMLESIPWEEIRKTSNKLGRALASLINGFVEVEGLGNEIGKTIAQSVNTVFEFLNGFVHKLHWDSIGKFIAETFNGFFKNIDWNLIKDTVVTGMAGIAEAIQNFIDTFDWDNVSTTIINGVDTITAGLLAFFDGIDWLDLGRKMGEQIRKSVEGIDWYQVGEAMGAIIQSAVDWVSGLIETMPSVETLIEKATDLMHGLFDRVDFETMGANLAIILNNVYDFLTGFWEENGDEIKNKVKEFFKGFWDNIDKEDLKTALGKILEVAAIGGIAYALGAFVKLYIKTKLTQLITEAAGSSAVKNAATTAGSTIGGIFKAGFIGAIAIGIGNWLIEAVQGWWGNLILSGMREAGYSEAEIDAKKKDLEYLEERYSGLTGKLQLFKDVFTGMEDIKLPSEEVENFTIVVEDLREPVIKIQDDLDQFGRKATENSNTASTAMNTLRTNTDKDTTAISTDVKGMQTSFDDSTKEIIKDIESIQKGMTKDKWTFQGVADGLEETFRRAKNAIKGQWNEIADTLNGEHEVGTEKIKIDLPKFARGGFPEDGLFMANHNELVGSFSNGRTAVANNEQIIQGISAGVYNAVSRANSDSSGAKYIANTIVVDGEVIARSVTKAQERQNMRYSPTLA